MELIVIIDKKDSKTATAQFENHTTRVCIGKNGSITEDQKTEGDGKTPLGTYNLKHVYYRADKIKTIDTLLPTTPITPNMGWCDDLKHPSYNTLITTPFTASHENMYRDDHLYDIVVEISHNDAPPIPGKGSAIFMHLKRAANTPTLGCIAFDKQDLLDVLKNATSDSKIDIRLDSA